MHYPRWLFFGLMVLVVGWALAPCSWAEQRFPLPAGLKVVNVKDLGAVGDGRTDDTAALQAAIGGGERYKLVYLPPGTYLVSEPINFGQRRVWVQGHSRADTVIRLKDRAAGFQDPDRPRPVLATWGAWDRERFGNVSSAVIFRQELYHLTIDVGTGNPGAAGLIFHTSNAGRVFDVTIRSSDPARRGAFGLGLTIPWPGPGLIDQVTVEGFDYGIYSQINQYSLTFKDLTLRNQRKAGIYNRKQALHFHRLLSQQRRGVPVLDTERSAITIVSGRFYGDAPLAIDARRTRLYLRDILAEGYGTAAQVRNGGNEQAVPGPVVEAFASGPWTSLEGNGDVQGSLHLPIEETPEVPWGAPEGWVYVGDFGEVGANVDSSVAFQRAIDSGAHTVYFQPKDMLHFRNPVRVRGNVRRIIGFGGRIDAGEVLGERPVFHVVDGEAPVVVFERMGQYGRHAGPVFLHDTKRGVVLRSLIVGSYTAIRPGDLFAEDVSMIEWRLTPGQRAWMWQVNPEAGKTFNFDNHGADLWVMGLKTEGGRTSIASRGTARTELLGSYIYNNSGWRDRANFVLKDQAIGSFVANNSDFPVAVSVERPSGSRELPARDFTGFYTSAPRSVGGSSTSAVASP
ncbi:MAG: glycoside hydrolase family 55 protein [Opitutales bacterium]